MTPPAPTLTHAEMAVDVYPDAIDHLCVLGTANVSVLTGTWPAEGDWDHLPPINCTMINLNTEPPKLHRVNNGDGWCERKNLRADYHFFNPAGSTVSFGHKGANSNIEVGLPLPFCRKVLEDIGSKVSPDFAALSNAWGYDDFLSVSLKRLAGIARRPSAATAILADHIAYALVVHLNTIGTPSPTRTARGQPLSFRQMRRLRAYADENLAHPISLRDLAATLGFTPPYFCRVFKMTTHQTPFQWFTRLRAERALALLGQAERPSADDVARACGFANRRHLSRSLRAIYGQGIAALVGHRRSG